MNYYISNGTFYAVQPTSGNELCHFGIKGMKWGKRKARPVATGGMRRASNVTPEQQAAQREARKVKAKKALKIGAAVAGTALAAYGAYKLDKAIKNKAYAVAHKRGVEAASKFMKDFNKNTSGPEAMKRSANLGKYLSDSNHDYARRSSRTTSAAVKTLLGKNYEFTEAELWNMGINRPKFK